MKPEMCVRRLVHSLGYRYRLHVKGLPGKPDLVFRSRRKVIFVHGCFWHQHEAPECPCKHIPASNLSYWRRKLERNVERDREQQDLLAAEGWKVLVVWECEATDTGRLKPKIRRFLGSPGDQNHASSPPLSQNARDSLTHTPQKRYKSNRKVVKR